MPSTLVQVGEWPQGKGVLPHVQEYSEKGIPREFSTELSQKFSHEFSKEFFTEFSKGFCQKFSGELEEELPSGSRQVLRRPQRQETCEEEHLTQRDDKKVPHGDSLRHLPRNTGDAVPVS